MAPNRYETELRRTDVATFLGALAGRLHVHGLALQGMAALDGAPSSVEARAQGDLADDLEGMAARLDLLRGRLCRHCQMLEVVELISIHGGMGGKRRA